MNYGWKEFDTPTGPMRAEMKSDRIWCVFKKSDENFICVGTFATKNNSCKEIWEAAEESAWILRQESADLAALMRQIPHSDREESE